MQILVTQPIQIYRRPLPRNLVISRRSLPTTPLPQPKPRHARIRMPPVPRLRRPTRRLIIRTLNHLKISAKSRRRQLLPKMTKYRQRPQSRQPTNLPRRKPIPSQTINQRPHLDTRTTRPYVNQHTRPRPGPIRPQPLPAPIRPIPRLAFALPHGGRLDSSGRAIKLKLRRRGSPPPSLALRPWPYYASDRLSLSIPRRGIEWLWCSA
jgi:hypothetical protein